ncbi:MAG: anaerobic carbon-monoxide dehydrogenase catalytic subunit [Armatimonadota bacterium]|nr:anaerobic carbon-monoxide dehydrogenase catalytic subunit [Armatimonadota bacterium]MDR7463795.1 anaerobic carbon-monoxide dehydrogenase catalytic subunit [Armatimonadota bacterium]MDR7469459.1 anaerobic carbon-monoxide dehydrogenase catalytic subunit [Armatimonadota bacterium]MDR7473835.1 anaerobic carbon-monoxide dehydrogenase catalytic subunit [Armatimonadota bacterium]MDR7539106.1 anaerobic carbon-monoxide dehydrogenase catalytic subunit [Armatimonadota bacterium]
MERSLDIASQAMLEVAQRRGIATVWDRFQAQQPQCGFGLTGLCCRMCLQGPCRIDPFGEGPRTGTCGASADTIVARNLARMIAAGTASHSGHAKHLAHTMLRAGRGEASDYPVKDEAKLREVATRVGIPLDGKDTQALMGEVAAAALAEFSEKEAPLTWAATTVTPGRVQTFLKYGVVPTSIDGAVAEVMHRTTYGTDADPANILLGGIKCALADYAGMHIATDLADILFGVPRPVVSRANLGVLKADAVNIALHGHNPVLSDVIVQVASEMQDEARAAGAADGLNLVGICCTGNEVLMRHGIPPATHSVSQELAILTGALDAMVVDYQCIMPSLANVAECYHTQLVTTMPISKIPGARHVEFHEGHARASAREIIRLAIDAYRRRDPAKVNIPTHASAAVAGFSSEAILGALAAVNKDDPLKPLIDNIVSGNILGICLFAGCNNVRVTQDSGFVSLAKELAKENVLLLATGCGAGAYARHGLLTSDAAREYAGPGLGAVLGAVGQAVGLDSSLPLVLHMGSCVDNTRAADVAVAVANKLGVDLDKLPVVASAPEATTEKAIAIGTWAVAAGLPVHVGVVPPVLGGPAVTRLLTEGVKELFGGYFIVEPDPVAAARKLLQAIRERRATLGV